MSRCEMNETKECTHCGQCEICDLDPNKICDNCCKCIEAPQEDEEYAVLPVQMQPSGNAQAVTDDWEEENDLDDDEDSWSGQESFDEEDSQEEDLISDSLTIDPCLMLEWEEKLRASFAETAEERGERPAPLYGRRVKKRGD